MSEKCVSCGKSLMGGGGLPPEEVCSACEKEFPKWQAKAECWDTLSNYNQNFGESGHDTRYEAYKQAKAKLKEVEDTP